ALALAGHNEFDEAERSVQEAIEIVKHGMRPDSRIITQYEDIIKFVRDRKQQIDADPATGLTDAERMLRSENRSESMRRRNLERIAEDRPAGRPLLAQAALCLARHLRDEKRFQEATPLAHEAFEILKGEVFEGAGSWTPLREAELRMLAHIACDILN